MNDKKIKNYTSSVSVDRTIGGIEQELVKIGVTRIEKNYEGGMPSGIIFTIELPTKLRFRIPANIGAAYDIIKAVPQYKRKNAEWLQAQANRTAWRIVYNWIEIQVAMVQLRQADAIQVFMTYIYDGKQTFYERISKNNFKALLPEPTK